MLSLTRKKTALSSLRRRGIHMRTPARLQALAIATALVVLAGCTGGPAFAPKPTTPQDHMRWLMSNPNLVSPSAPRDVHVGGQRYKSYDACPGTGAIEYFVDATNSVINIYAGKLAGQGPCGQIAHVALLNPQGIVVDKQHNLFVANTGNANVLAFHRGKTSPFRTYTDTTNGSQFPVDVAVSDDGVVFATNIFSPNTGIGSISTFNKSTGALIGNYQNPNSGADYFITVQKNGTVYWDDNGPTLWTGSCALGVCGAFTATGASFAFPGGIKSADGEDVVLLDQSAQAGSVLTTYEPPDFSSGVSCTIAKGQAVAMFDIDKRDRHLFFGGASGGVELKYPSCVLVGHVNGTFGGVAVDPAGPLK
jgi:hypothetical protein